MHGKAKFDCFNYMQPQKVKFKSVQINMKHVSYTFLIVLVQPRLTRPCLTERFLMGLKESNQTNKRFEIK